MFKGTKSFNGDISTWKTGSIVNMKSLFGISSSGVVSGFNGDISKWQTHSVKDMSHMFDGKKGSGNGFNSDISKWNTGAVLSTAYSKYYSYHCWSFFNSHC